MRFLAIVCLAGMCGLAITMLFHMGRIDKEEKSWIFPYLACVLVILLGGIGFSFTWNAERDRSIQVEKLKIKYEQVKGKRIVSR